MNLLLLFIIIMSIIIINIIIIMKHYYKNVNISIVISESPMSSWYFEMISAEKYKFSGIVLMFWKRYKKIRVKHIFQDEKTQIFQYIYYICNC